MFWRIHNNDTEFPFKTRFKLFKNEVAISSVMFYNLRLISPFPHHSIKNFIHVNLWETSFSLISEVWKLTRSIPMMQPYHSFGNTWTILCYPLGYWIIWMNVRYVVVKSQSTTFYFIVPSHMNSGSHIWSHSQPHHPAIKKNTQSLSLKRKRK